MSFENDQQASSRLFLVPKSPKPDIGKLQTTLSNGMVVIKSEFTGRLEELLSEFTARYAPEGPTEKHLVMDLASTLCRCEYVEMLKSRPGIATSEKMVASLTRYHESNTRQHKRTLRQLEKIRKEREKVAALRPRLVKSSAAKPTETGEY